MGWLDWLNDMFGPESRNPDYWNKKFQERMAKEQKEKDEIFDMSKNIDHIKKHNISCRMEEDSKSFNEVREERRKEEKAVADLKFVIDTAKLQCDLCTNPIGSLKVNYNTPTIQDKKTATVKEKDQTSLIFNGNCKKSPQSSSPCASVMQLGDWANVGSIKVQDQFPLLQKSTIKCNYGGVDIKITDCGQRNEPTNIESFVLNKTEPDFDISFELDTEQETVVPFGILDFENNAENPFFTFKYTLSKSKIDSMNFQILDEDDSAIYQMHYLEPVIVQAFKKVQIISESKNPVQESLISKTWDYQGIYGQYTLLESDDYTQIGEYYIHWDGFDNDGIYDSTRFNNKKLKAKITATKDGIHKHIIVDFATQYSQVEWTDVKIDKNAKRIDVTLRVNLTDGGENGLTCQTINENMYGMPARTVCDWNKIPASVINPSNPIIKSRTKTFEDLKKIVFAGLERYWGRNKSNIVGNSVNIIDSYEVFINPVDTTQNALNPLPLIYNTNGGWMRSGNPGGSYSDGNLDDNLLNALPDLGIIQRLSYNVGYIYEYHFLKTWEYQNEASEIDDFEETAAHELGHEILQAYAGTVYSWQHKGSSYYLPQDTKPNKGNETVWDKMSHLDEMDTHGENYPLKGEIDVMKYYNKTPRVKDRKRTIANENDVLGLLWLTKLQIK